MPIVNPSITQFNTGEITPFLLGRTDFKKYASSAQYMENCLPLVYGPFVKRSGTRYVNSVKASAIKVISSNDDLTVTTGTVPRYAYDGEVVPLVYSSAQSAWCNVEGEAVTLSSYGIASITGTPANRDTLLIVYTLASDAKILLKPFIFSKTQAYTLEIGAGYIRFHAKNGTVITSEGNPVEVLNTGFTASDLDNLRFAQSNDYLYIASGRLPLKVLKRYSHQRWELENVSFTDGPYQDENIDKNITVAASATAPGASATLTASADLFTSDMVGMPIRLRKVAVGSSSSNCIGWGTITAVANARSATCLVEDQFFDTEATYAWRIGEFSSGRGYPKQVTLFKGRLCLASTESKPNSLWLSRADSYHDFGPTTQLDNEVNDDDAIYLTMAATETNQIQWMTALRQLFVGTLGSEFRIGGTNEVITPSNCSSEEVSQYGSTGIAPCKHANELIYVQQAERKIRTMYYDFSTDSYNSTDLSLFGEHLTYSGIAGLVQQIEPFSTLWAWLKDGKLRSVSYQKDQEVVAWARQTLGGNRVKVLSACVIPYIEENRDQVWLLVERWIDDKFVRYIETLDRVFDDQVSQEMGYFVDCGGTYNNPLTITDMYTLNSSTAHYTIVECPDHGLATGARVRFADIDNGVDNGTVAKGFEQLNDKSFYVTKYDDDTLIITHDSSTYVDYNSWQGGVLRAYVYQLTSGLEHLEGEEVWVVVDGAVTPKTRVTDGIVVLDTPGTIVHVGLPYTCKYKSVRLDTSLGQNNALATKQRIHHLYIKVHRTNYFLYGANEATELKPARKYTVDKLDFPPELKTELIEIPFEAEWTREPVLTIESDLPLPL